jgi:hypothetical protein
MRRFRHRVAFLLQPSSSAADAVAASSSDAGSFEDAQPEARSRSTLPAKAMETKRMVRRSAWVLMHMV